MHTTALVPVERAKEVTALVKDVKANLVDNLLYLGELLSEAKANSYAEMLGFSSFAEWLDSSGLDMSERQAYYLIKIIDNAKTLGIEKQSLSESKMSSLKEIFSLDPVTHAEQIKELVAKSPEMKLNQVRDEVESIKSGSGLEPTTWLNFRVTDTQALVIRQALGMAGMQYGQLVNPDTQEVTEASNGTLLADVICTTYTQAAQQDETDRREHEYANIINVEV
jgi:hypothetical protein